MPRVNIYIRNEDLEAWQNIPDKPKWIHEGLSSGLVMIPPKTVTARAVKLTKPVNKINIPNREAKKVLDGVRACEHGAAKGYCRFSKCEYSKA